MDLGLVGKRVLVTGGSKGIGKSICEIFLEEGAQVEFCARDATHIAATEKELSIKGTIKGSSVDVSDMDAVTSWVNDAAGRMGGLDYVVSNASGLAIGATKDAWEKGLHIDIFGAQALFDAALPHLAKSSEVSGDAGVVVVSSVSAAETSYPNAYGAVKAALIHLVKGIARAHAGKKVRCNAVSPGTVYFKGGVWNSIEENMPDNFKLAMDRNPTGRMATPEEIANAVVFLASPRSSFTTGANLVVDGGITQRVNF